MVVFIGLLAGVILGLYFPGYIPKQYSTYVAVALLASFDSIVGSINARLRNRFNTQIFISGFFVNTILAVFLAYVGTLLDIDLYLAAVVVFGSRLFTNFAEIRRIILNTDAKK